jgi:hypothetical protein
MASLLPTVLEPLILHELKEIPHRGIALVATKRLDPGIFGFELLDEKPLLLSPIRGSEHDFSGEIYPTELSRYIQPQLWTDYWSYKQLSLGDQEKVRNLYYDKSTTHQFIQALRQALSKESSSFLDFDLQEFVIVSMVYRLNCAAIPQGRGLFARASRLNHSCRPNCVWFHSSAGNRVVRLVLPLEQGEEFTIDYIESRMVPRVERRRLLQKSKSFMCECKRCTSLIDDTRRFPCHNCNAGVHLCSQESLNGDNETSLLECNQCGSAATQTHDEVEILENAIQSELDVLNRLLDSGLPLSDFDSNRIMQVRPPHPLHYLASDNLFIVQGKQLERAGDANGYIAACRDRLQCYEAILGIDFPNSLTAIACEMLADALQSNGEWEQAERLYQKTVRILQITDGSSRPLSQCAMQKLLDLQQFREANTSNTAAATMIIDSSKKCSLCGAMADKKCSRCGTVQYCCKNHQTNHWSAVHKKQCQKK